MSVECDRAAVWSLESRCSAWRPWAALVEFIAASRLDTVVVLVFAARAAGAAKRRKPTAKRAEICFIRSTKASFATDSDVVSPPDGGTGRGLLPRRLGEENPRQ